MTKFALNIKLQYMIRKVFSLLFFIIFSFNSNLISQGCGGPEIVDIGGADGSFESCSSIVASPVLNSNVTCGGWSNGIGTADTHNQNNSMSLIPSPDGGVFAALFSNSAGSLFNRESFYTDVTNLTVGKVYTLRFYIVNAGNYNTAGASSSVRLKVTFGSEEKETSTYTPDGYGNQVWDEVTMSFTATSTSQRLTFESLPLNPILGYMGIDGIRLTTDNTSSNNAPIANDDGNQVDEGGIESGNVLSNDTDADGDVLQIVAIVDMPNYGSLTFNSSTGEYVYQHFGDEQFSDLFTYVMTDGTCTDTADVVLSIIPKNDPPTVIQDTFYVNEGDTLTVLNSDPNLIINNDIDPDNTVSDFTAQLSIPTLYNAAGTTFLLGSKGAFQYIHGCNNASLDIFQYYVSDGTTQSEFQDSVLIYILNEAPFGEPDFYSVDNGETLIVDDELSGLLANDVDSFACDTLTVTLVQPPSMHLGAFDLDTNGTFTYIHDGSFAPTQDYFVYQLSDGQDNALETDTVFININNPGPNTQSLNFAVDEGKQLIVDSLQGILTVSSSNLGLPLSVELHQAPFRGTLLPSGEINDDGSFVYEHDCTDMPNEDYFLFKVSDSVTESIDTVFITVNNVCPTGENDFYQISEGQTIDISAPVGVLFNDTDDNVCDPLSATLVVPPLYHTGTFTLNQDGSFIYTHDDSENFEDQFSYRLSDGECNGAVYTVILGIDSVSDVPPIARDDSFIPCLKEGETLNITTYADGVLGNDNDPDPKDDTLTAELVQGVSHGTLLFNDDGTFTYTHDGGEDESDFFTYVAFDGDFYSLDTAVVTICIDQVNDCPDAIDDNFTINEGQVLDSTVARNDVDADLITADNNYSISIAPSVGTLELRSDGSFTYVPPSQIDPPGPQIVTFEYEITDPDPSTNCSDKATVTIRINSINDCPVANDDTIYVDALNNDLIIKDLIANDVDIDNPLDSSSIFILDPPLYGDLIVNDDGTITYDYIGSPSKRDSITYAVQDSLGCISNFAKVWINIENIQFPEYELPSYFTPNGDRFYDFFTIKYKNIILGNVKFEVKIMDRYQRIVFEGDVYNDMIWDGIDKNSTGDAKKGLYFYEITPIEYGDIRARTIVGVIFLDR